jgi:ribosomal protein S8
MDIRSHGGGCCGIRHIFAFDGTSEQVRTRLRGLLTGPERPRNRAVEVVLIPSQQRNYGRILEEEGFIPTFSFVNGNTGNTCIVYFYHERPQVIPRPARAISINNIAVGDQVLVTNNRARNHGRVVVVTRRDGDHVITDSMQRLHSSSIQKVSYAPANP